MKILLGLRLVSQPLAARLAHDSALAKALGPEPNPFVGFLFKKFFDAQGPVLGQVLAHAMAEGERMDFLRHMQFSRQELGAVTHLEVVCRKTIGQSDAESRTTLDDYRHDPLHSAPGRWRVRLPRRMFLAKPVPAEAISHVDQYTGEYVLGTRAAHLLSASSLTGWELQPVLHWKTQEPLPEVGMHLTTRALLPPVAPSPTVFETYDDGPGAPSTPRRHGLLSYADDVLASSPDFARTAEPWGAWSVPQWVVRQQVRAWYEEAGLKGWEFWPVLREGTALHAEHEEKWARVREQLDASGAKLFT